MKWIIYLLLLANIGLFVWHYPALQRYQESSRSAGAGGNDGTLSLVLLREAKQQAVANARRQQCRSLGPFADKAQARRALSLVETAGIAAQLRISKDARRKAYWVLLPPAESRQAALEHIARLKQLQVKDYFLVATGEMTNAVSLGVFSKFESAHRRIKEMQKLGFRPEFRPVELPVREYWVEWPVERDQARTAADLLARARRISAAVRLQTGPCR